AERTYATIFGPVGQSSQTIPGYRVRAYAGGHYLGVNDSGAVHLYYLGPLNNNAVLDLGLLSGWVAQAGP
ncbi:MAG: regulator, partial [Burkholderiales bacterium]